MMNSDIPTHLTGLFSFHTFASFPPGWHINSLSISPFLRVPFSRSILMWEMTSLGSSVNWVSLDAQHRGGRKKYLHNRAPDVGKEKSFVFSRKETSSLFNIFHITQAALCCYSRTRRTFQQTVTSSRMKMKTFLSFYRLSTFNLITRSAKRAAATHTICLAKLKSFSRFFSSVSCCMCLGMILRSTSRTEQ